MARTEIAPSGMTTTDRKFLNLMRLALSGTPTTDSITPGEWREIYRTAAKQAVTTVIADAADKLPQTQMPPKEVAMKIAAVAIHAERQNKALNKACCEITGYFAQKGMRSCILKGQGNATMWPNPMRRHPGDIDIWVEGGVKKLLPAARQMGIREKVCYHHVGITPYKGIEVELHFRPGFMQNPIHNARLQRFFAQNADKAFCNKTALPHSAGYICTPTNSFNRIQQLAHIINHFGHEGIGLRQVADYYWLLCQGFTAEENAADREMLKRLGMTRFAQALMWILHNRLGLDDKHLMVSPDEKRGRFLLEEIMMSGNFGHADTRVSRKTRSNALLKNIERLKRDFRLIRFYPTEMTAEPFFRMWHFGWRIFHR